MVDFSTQTRQNGYMFSVVERINSLCSFKECYRRTEPLVFSSPRTAQHDCRGDSRQVNTDPKLWEAMMFSFGMNKTYESEADLHSKIVEKDPLEREPDKLLYAVGKKGNGKQQFNYPRGVATDSEGDIIIADTKNHRIQRFNSAGIYKDEFGSKGEYRGELLNPTDVAVLNNDDIVVADSGNCRMQIFRPHGRLKHIFNTKNNVVYIACDAAANMYCSTVKRTIEIYSSARQMINTFPITPDAAGALPIQVSSTDELIVCDILENKIKLYSFSGKLLHQFEPYKKDASLGCQLSSLALNPIGQIIVADSLNHVVDLYSPSGEFISELLRPTDDAGCVQAVAVGPEGHLVVLEYTANGPHCLKIFRYGSCLCHRSRCGSSKRSSPN